MRKQTFIVKDDRDHQALGIALRSLRRTTKRPLKVVVSEERKRFTWNQSAALFGHAYPIICRETGATPDDCHEYFCGQYFGTTTISFLGQTKTKPVRTTTTNEMGEHDPISTKDFAQFFTFVQDSAAEEGYHIPDPDKDWKKKIQQQIEKEENHESTQSPCNMSGHQLERTG